MQLTREEAKILAIFLLRERWRHLQDIRQIDQDLDALEKRFGFTINRFTYPGNIIGTIDGEYVVYDFVKINEGGDEK